MPRTGHHYPETCACVPESRTIPSAMICAMLGNAARAAAGTADERAPGPPGSANDDPTDHDGDLARGAVVIVDALGRECDLERLSRLHQVIRIPG